jgi:hypothetical protein
MIYIATNYEGYITSIVNAKDESLAKAYWQGKGIIPNTILNLEKDFTSLDEHPTGVYPLISTKETEIKEGFNYKKIVKVVQ